MKTIKLSLQIFFGLAFSGAYAQTMYVRPIAGAQSGYPVANIEKITFSGGNMLVTNSTGGNGTFALAGNRYINFTDLTLAIASNERANNRFYAYPNPVSSILHFGNDNPTQTMSQIIIYSLEGRMLIAKDIFAGNTPQIEVNQLPAGIYFCKIMAGNQTQTIRFLKQ
jgi:hypothetical protein